VDLACPEDADSVTAALQNAPVLVSFIWEDRFLTPALRWVQSISAGTEQFPLARLAAAGVVLTSARGVHGPQVAEHAFALLLALTRGIGYSMRNAVERSWRQYTGDELTGRTLGVLGLGPIGEEVARRARAWGMQVVGCTRRPHAYQGVLTEVLGLDQVREVCRRSHAVVAALPDAPETRNLIDAAAFAALGDGWLVNVGRGSAVDLAALLDALDRGELRGAGLDVFPTEPLPPESPLWSHPRVVLTPHVGGLSPRYGPRLAELTAANLAALHGRGEWVNRVV
jgi:phosphoglycerate dehydrogenase-like enzyme